MSKLLVLVAAASIVYLNVLPNQFAIDDAVFIKNWQAIGDARNIPQLLKGELPPDHQGVYRPVRSLLYLSYYHLFGTNPVGWHIHGIVVHAASSILVFLILRKIRGIGERGGVIGAILFAMHPIHTEAISYISASMEMTGIAFMLGAFYFYLSRHRHRILLMTALALLAFFTYEMALALPVLLVLYELLFQKKPNVLRSNTIWITTFMVISIRFVILGITSRGDYLGFSFYHKMLMMPKVIVYYIWLLINPVNSSYIHELAPGFESFMTHYSRVESILTQSIFDWQVLASIGGIVSLIVIAIKVRKKHPVVSFGISWFFVSLLPVSYILPQGIALAEKYLYSASIGFVMVLAYILGKLQRSIKIIIIIILILSYAFLTIRRNTVWRNDIVFWQNVVREHPKSALGWYQLGVYLSQSKRTEKATESYIRAISFEPRFYEAYFNLGNIFHGQHYKDKAQKMYELALKAKPDFTPAKDMLVRLDSELDYTHFSSKKGLIFDYPQAWALTDEGDSITIDAPGKAFHVVIQRSLKDPGQAMPAYIALNGKEYGLLMKEGAVKVSDREGFVRFWFDDDHQLTELYLSDGSTVMHVTDWPSNSPLAKQMETIISSIEFSK